MSNFEGLIKSLGPDRVKFDEPLSSHTTLRIGGPADLLYVSQNSGELIKAIRLARSFEVPVTIIGGAVFNNIHGGNHVFSEIVKDVVVLTRHGDVMKIPVKSMRFEYDKSRLHTSGEIVLEAVLNLRKGNVEKAKAVADEWRRRKSSQPFNSAGCVFKNISEQDRQILGYPTTATGYIVEHILNMTGYKVGGAMISPDHHDFIVNAGGATAKDYLAVRDEVIHRAKEAIGLELEDEIILLGDFD